MALSFCLRDTAAFPCSLTPSAPAAAGFSRVQGNASPHVFPVLSLCTAVHDRKTIPYFAPMCKLFFHLMPHAPPECKAERPEPACRVGAFSADVRGFQLPPYCLRQQGPTLGSSAGETPAPQAKNTTAPGRRGIGSGRRGGSACIRVERWLSWFCPWAAARHAPVPGAGPGTAPPRTR